MAGDEISKVDRVLPQQIKGKSPIKSEELQGSHTNVREAGNLHQADAFNKLLAYYKELGQAEEIATANPAMSEQQKLHEATREAEATFNTMMEISQQLRETSRDILEMNS